MPASEVGSNSDALVQPVERPQIHLALLFIHIVDVDAACVFWHAAAEKGRLSVRVFWGASETTNKGNNVVLLCEGAVDPVDLLLATTQQQQWTTGLELAYRTWVYALPEETFFNDISQGGKSRASQSPHPPRRRRLGPASFAAREYKHESCVHAALNSMVPGVEWERNIRHAKIRWVLKHPV